MKQIILVIVPKVLCPTEKSQLAEIIVAGYKATNNFVLKIEQDWYPEKDLLSLLDACLEAEDITAIIIAETDSLYSNSEYFGFLTLAQEHEAGYSTVHHRIFKYTL